MKLSLPHRTGLVLAALILGLLCAAPPVQAYDFLITARTEGHGYQLRRYQRDGVVFLNRRRMTQHLGLRVYNLLDPGQDPFRAGTKDPPRLLTFNLLMRFDTDFGGFIEPAHAIPELQNNEFDLVVAALEGRNFFGRVDFSLGRIYEMDLLDIFAYDGLKVRINLPWQLFAEAGFGAQVARAHPLSRAVFETDSAAGDAAAEAWSPTFSAAVGLDDLWDLDLKLAYRGVVSKAAKPGAEPGDSEIWGVDQELIYLGAGWQVPVIGLRPSLGLRYNLVTAQVDDLTVALSQRLASRHAVTVGYLRSIPHFDGDSIFNIFDTEPYHEASLAYSVRLLSPLSAHLRLGYRAYWEDEIEAAKDARPDGWSAGAGARWRADKVRAGVDLYYLDGHGGLTVGGDLDGAWSPLRWLTIQGRVSLIHHEGTGLTAADGLNFGAQLGALFTFFKGITGHLLLEDNVSSQYQSALRLLGVLSLEVAP